MEFNSEKILDAIKQDNLALFSDAIGGNENLSLGRFPLLTVCFIYGASRIVDKYKANMRKYNTYNVIDEPLELSTKFRTLAGRAMRLYLKDDSIVSPLEVLAVLRKDKMLKKQYLLFEKNDIIIKNIKTIYALNHQECQGDSFYISISPPPLSFKQKNSYRLSLVLSAVFVFVVSLCYALIGVTSGLGALGIMAKIYTPQQFYSALKTGGEYVLARDIEIDMNNLDIDFNGKINGNNYKLIVNNYNKNYIFKTNNGDISNLEIQINGFAKTINSDLSLFVLNNNGSISNVNISCESINLNATKNSKDIRVSGIAINNNGIIKNCSVDFNLNIIATGSGECMVGGITAINNGVVSTCRLTNQSSIETSECDVAGLVCLNQKDGKVLDSINCCKLKQTSADNGWSPNVAGVVLTNYGEVSNSHNIGELDIVSTNDRENAEGSVFLGGIVAINYGNIVDCINNGNLNCLSSRIIVYAGGVSAYSTYVTTEEETIMPKLDGCGVNSVISITNSYEDGQMCVGGLSGYLYGELKNCYSLATFTNGYVEQKHFVGLAIGAVYYQTQLFSGYLCLSADNNDVWLQENVTYHLGVVLQYGNRPISNGIDVDDVEDIRTVFSADNIIEKEVGNL